MGGLQDRRGGLRRTALVDVGAIARNAADAAGDDLGRFAADLRADAYGHGLLSVARALARAGIGGVVVSHAVDAERLRAADLGVDVLEGIPGSGSGARSTIESHMSRGSASSVDVRPWIDTRTSLSLLTAGRLFGVESRSRPTIRLTAEVASVKTVAAGVGVSYGYTYRTARETRLALVGLGFADGVPRTGSNRAPVRIGDVTGTISGRVAMDQFVVDLGDADAVPGDDAVLFGSTRRSEPTLADWAAATGLDALVILCRLGGRIRRETGAL